MGETSHSHRSGGAHVRPTRRHLSAEFSKSRRWRRLDPEFLEVKKVVHQDNMSEGIVERTSMSRFRTS